MDWNDILHLRAAILAGEINRLAEEAHLEGNDEVCAQLEAAERALATRGATPPEFGELRSPHE